MTHMDFQCSCVGSYGDTLWKNPKNERISAVNYRLRCWNFLCVLGSPVSGCVVHEYVPCVRLPPNHFNCQNGTIHNVNIPLFFFWFIRQSCERLEVFFSWFVLMKAANEEFEKLKFLCFNTCMPVNISPQLVTCFARMQLQFVRIYT